MAWPTWSAPGTVCCVFHDPRCPLGAIRLVAARALEDLTDFTFADPRVKWADLPGDGLQDLVIVHQGSVRTGQTRVTAAWAAP